MKHMSAGDWMGFAVFCVSVALLVGSVIVFGHFIVKFW
jgi:hypothetical protein